MMPARAVGARLLDLRLLFRHQASALIATAIDFATMVALVELLGAPPPIATLVSAALGGLTNFVVSRRWAFHQLHQGSASGQAFRYALVCAGGALLNACLLRIALLLVAGPYVVARVFISILVSGIYTYPLHTRFVFRARAAS